MSNLLKIIPLLSFVCSVGFVSAEETENVLPQVVATTEMSEVDSAALIEIPAMQAEETTPAAPEVKSIDNTQFTAFTGKVRGQNVRLRLNPELDGYILKELNKDTLISVVGKKGDFWAVEPMSDTKVYIFRSFILDNTVEGNRVNVRLEPSLEAPIVGHMNTGDKVNGVISPLNKKWLEISPPEHVKFYVAKEYIENVGIPEVKVEFEARQSQVEELLETTAFLVKAELLKSFADIDVERLMHNYKTIINDYTDFPEHVKQATQELAALNDIYLQRKIEYLENKTSAQEEVLSSVIKAEEAEDSATDRMKLWEPIEESLYLTWSRLNEDRNMLEYYEEQKLNSVVLTGIVEAYRNNVKSKPGDFILKEGDLPVGYVYSTEINLCDLVGKKVSLIASPRPNNNFAFPAYFVHDVQ